MIHGGGRMGIAYPRRPKDFPLGGRQPPRGSLLPCLTACRRSTTHALRKRARPVYYLIEVEIDENWVFSFVPNPFTTAMMASAMPAAIRPYSIAVAPDSSERNFVMYCFNFASAGKFRRMSLGFSTLTAQNLRLRESGTFNFPLNCNAINLQI
jgi:hypothetical protein